MINKIRVKHSKKWCLVDLIDEFVLYQGTYAQCISAIDTIYGGTFGVIHHRNLTDKERDSLIFLSEHEETNA
jgi:hypothetical protein